MTYSQNLNFNVYVCCSCFWSAIESLLTESPSWNTFRLSGILKTCSLTVYPFRNTGTQKRYVGQGGKTTAHALRKTRPYKFKMADDKLYFATYLGSSLRPHIGVQDAIAHQLFSSIPLDSVWFFLNDNRMFFRKCFLYHCTVFDDSCSRR